MDAIVNARGHAILTMTERSTNFKIMQKLPHGRKVIPMERAVGRLLFPYKKTLGTITTDVSLRHTSRSLGGLSVRGREKVTVYLADSYCLWQKGAIENANKLIRRYITKKADLNETLRKRKL